MVSFLGWDFLFPPCNREKFKMNKIRPQNEDIILHSLTAGNLEKTDGSQEIQEDEHFTIHLGFPVFLVEKPDFYIASKTSPNGFSVSM